MTTIKAFNEMMGQFLEELTATFPDEEAPRAMKEQPRTRETFDAYMNDVAPFSTELMAKNSTFFVPENKFVNSLNLHVIWGSELATENTKSAIWQYLQTMYILGNTISMFPPETLAMIENAAEACAKNMKSQDNMNEQALMAGMNNMLTQMMAGGNLFGTPPPQKRLLPPKPKSRKK